MRRQQYFPTDRPPAQMLLRDFSFLFFVFVLFAVEILLACGVVCLAQSPRFHHSGRTLLCPRFFLRFPAFRAAFARRCSGFRCSSPRLPPRLRSSHMSSETLCKSEPRLRFSVASGGGHEVAHSQTVTSAF